MRKRIAHQLHWAQNCLSLIESPGKNFACSVIFSMCNLDKRHQKFAQVGDSRVGKRSPFFRASLAMSLRKRKTVCPSWKLAGSRPGGRGTFFCVAKRKYPKKRRPYKAPCGCPQEREPLREAKRTRYAQTCFTSYPHRLPLLRRFAKG